MAVTEGSGVYAVIAPNMGKQIVALQVGEHKTVNSYPQVLGNYCLKFLCIFVFCRYAACSLRGRVQACAARDLFSPASK